MTFFFSCKPPFISRLWILYSFSFLLFRISFFFVYFKINIKYGFSVAVFTFYETHPLYRLIPNVMYLYRIFVIRSSLRTSPIRSEEHTSELQSRGHLVCRLLLEQKKPDHPRLRV